MKLLHCRKEAEISAANSKIPARTGAVACLPGQPATAAPCWHVIPSRRDFLHQPGAWNKGNCFTSSTWPFSQLMGSLGTQPWNLQSRSWVPLPQRTPCLVPSEQKSWAAELKAAPFARERNCSSRGVGKPESREQRRWQGRELLNYNINYLKHHLENHSALLLTSGQQLLVAKTWRRKKNLEKFASPESPDVFSSLLLSI